MELINTEVGLSQFMDLFISNLKSELSSHQASGNLINSLGYSITTVANGLSAQITSEAYLLNVDQGRSPGKFPPVDAIKNWVELKGIKIGNLNQTAYVIGRSIADKGIKPTNVIQTAFDNTFDSYRDTFSEYIAKDFEDLVDQINISIEKNNKI